MKALVMSAALGLACLSANASADWNLIDDESRLWFGSVKNESVGETHVVGSLTGHIDDDGKVAIEATTASLDSGIDIRDERMQEHLFPTPSLAISSNLDPTQFASLMPGDTLLARVPVSVTLGAAGSDYDTTVMVVRLSESRWLVVSDQPIWVDASSLGLVQGIATLQDIAGLSSIARTSPVGFRLLFESP
ncbi:YceI family protein [Halomonas sp. DP5Y7-2]|uniref:YceI family protein n=1 Tax=Halomonas sp. DP5Y7-2 TaxID=2859076 RepID=UPI001C9964DE|nr:YceI family protein [Halomonas sp. DP5Y7-2]MBY5983520.1 YceI family protein [Halomonas sp. DP5Y7-2]